MISRKIDWIWNHLFHGFANSWIGRCVKVMACQYPPPPNFGEPGRNVFFDIFIGVICVYKNEIKIFIRKFTAYIR